MNNSGNHSVDYEEDPDADYLINNREQGHVIIAYYIKPVLFLFGIFGNILSIIVLRRKCFRNSTSVYLLVLAIVCLIYVIFYSPLIFHEFDDNMSDGAVNAMIALQCFVIVYVVDSMCLAGFWITAVVAVERCLVVGMPLRSRLFCRRKYAWITCAVLIVCSLLINIPKTIRCRPNYENPDDMILLEQEGYDIIHATLGDIIIVFFLPFTITLVSNIILITFMVKRWKNAKGFSADGKERKSTTIANAAQKRAITMIVLANIFLYLVSQAFPTGLHIYIFIKGMGFYEEVMDGSLGFYSNTMNLTFFCFTSITYLVISRLYRNSVKSVLMSVIHRSQNFSSTVVSTLRRRSRQFSPRESRLESEGKSQRSTTNDIELTSKV